MKAIRLIFALIAAALVVGEASAAPLSGDIPLPRPRPASAGPRNGKVAAQVVAPALTTTPMVLAPAISATTSIPPSGVLLRRGDADTSRSATASIPLAAPVVTAPAVRASPPLATASTSVTSPLDLAAVKQAIELAQKGRPDEATSVEGRIYDPVARKLVEWVILRSDEADLNFPRYAAFISANPGWPGILFLRRRAEAALWQQPPDPRTVIAFFANEPPRTAKGRFALARALLAAGDRPGAQALISAAWRKDAFSADAETQARQMFAGLITPADDKARMDARFDVEDEEAGLRAASQLGRRRTRHRQGTLRRHRQIHQGQGAVRRDADRGAARCRLNLQPDSMAAPLRPDRGGDPADAGGAARSGKTRRCRPMVARTPGSCAQAARPG